MADVKDRVIAITGAGSGIGRALALLLARKGAKLVLSDKDADGLAETKRLLGNYPNTTAVLDVTDDAALKGWIDGAVADYGALDGIINNAGLSVGAPFDATPKVDFDRVMDVNFNAVVAGCRYALPHIRGRDAGWIVNISSVFGMMGYPGQSAYNASKFAVRGLTEALYLELAASDPQIVVSRVHPGGVNTNVARNAKMLVDSPDGRTREEMNAAFEKAAKTSPEQAAEVIVRGMERGTHRILIGADARMIDWVTRLFPTSYFKRIGMFLSGGQ